MVVILGGGECQGIRRAVGYQVGEVVFMAETTQSAGDEAEFAVDGGEGAWERDTAGS